MKSTSPAPRVNEPVTHLLVNVSLPVKVAKSSSVVAELISAAVSHSESRVRVAGRSPSFTVMVPPVKSCAPVQV